MRALREKLLDCELRLCIETKERLVCLKTRGKCEILIGELAGVFEALVRTGPVTLLSEGAAQIEN